MARTFDELVPGQRASLGEYHLTSPAALEFARQHDPEPYHLDEAAAAANPLFKRLSASGWQTALIMQDRFRAYVTQKGLAGLAGGAIELTFPKPVFPPVTLKVEMEVVSARASASRPHLGIATFQLHALNEEDEIVGTMRLTGLFAREP